VLVLKKAKKEKQKQKDLKIHKEVRKTDPKGGRREAGKLSPRGNWRSRHGFTEEVN